MVTVFDKYKLQMRHEDLYRQMKYTLIRNYNRKKYPTLRQNIVIYSICYSLQVYT